MPAGISILAACDEANMNQITGGLDQFLTVIVVTRVTCCKPMVHGDASRLFHLIVPSSPRSLLERDPLIDSSQTQG